MLITEINKFKNDLQFGKEVVNKYFTLLGVEDFYIEDTEDLIAGIQILTEKAVREKGLVELLRKHSVIHNTMNVFLSNHGFLIENNSALIYANRIDQLWLCAKKYINAHANEYVLILEKQQKDSQEQFIKELNNLTLPE